MMKLRINQYIFASLLVTALVVPRSMALCLQVISRKQSVTTASLHLLNIPDVVYANGEEEDNSHDLDYNSKEDKKGRNQNPVIGDMAFLRKRTADLLKITAVEGYERGCNDILGRKMRIDKKTFNWLIDSWAFSGELDAADKAYALLLRMEELGASDSGIRPDVRSYTKVINAISRSAGPDCGEKADKLLSKMESLYLSGKNEAAKPNTFTYTAVIEAYANSGSPGTASRAADVIDIMIQKWENGDEDVRPTSRSFNAAINAFAKSGEEGAAQHAESLFEQMVDIYETGNEECKPTAFNYNSVINALANSGEEGSAQRAEEFLERMESEYRKGDQDVKPTTITFNTVIDAFAKSGEEGAAQRAENVLRHMEEMYESHENMDAKPNVRSFNAVINAYAKSGLDDAAFKAERVLDLMERLYEAGREEVRPDVHSFSTVINGRSHEPRSILTQPPILGILTFVFIAWARSQKTGKADRALNLLREMEKLFEAGNEQLQPNVVAYNAVMNACAFTSGDVRESNRAVEIAHSVLKDMEQSDLAKPDQVTYGTCLKVCERQMTDCDSRDKLVEVLFRKCCKDGQVGNMVLQQLRLVTKPDHYVRLTGRAQWEDVKMEDFPQDWWCNVVEGKFRRRMKHGGTANKQQL
jgi:hypothetical protein